MARYPFLKAEFAPLLAAILREDPTADSIFGSPVTAMAEGELFDAFARRIDPTHARSGAPFKYLGWACRMFVAKAVTAEDIYKIHNNLRDFDTWSGVLSRDGKPNQIAAIASFDDLDALLRPYQQARAQKQRERQRRQMDEARLRALMAETTVVYSGLEGKVVIPHTMQACQHWGAQTKWCIAADRYQNRFDYYNNQHPIVIYLPRVAAEERAAWQNYSSFKFAAVGDNLYDELDKWGLSDVPVSLQKLARAAAQSLTGPSRRYVYRHGHVENILACGATPPVPAPDPSVHNATYAVWDTQVASLSGHGAGQALTEDEVFHNRDFVLHLVAHAWYDLRHFPERYRDDAEVVALAIKKGRGYLDSASPRLRDDKDFVIGVVSSSPYQYSYASQRLRADRDVFLAALKGEGIFSPMQHAHPSLKNDRDLAALAVRRHGGAFEYLSPRLRGDRGLYLMSRGAGYKHASRRLRGEAALLRLAVEYSSASFEHAPRHLRHNKALILDLIGEHPRILEHVPKRYLRDRAFMLAAVKRNGAALFYAEKVKLFSRNLYFRDDREIALAAVSTHGAALGALTPDLIKDPDLRRKAVEQRYGVLSNEWLFGAKDPLHSDRALALLAVQKDGQDLSAVAEPFQHDREIVAAAIVNSPRAWESVTDDFKRDAAFMCDVATALAPQARAGEAVAHLRHLPALWGHLAHFADPAVAKPIAANHPPARPRRGMMIEL